MRYGIVSYGNEKYEIQDMRENKSIAICPDRKTAELVEQALNHRCELPLSIQEALNSGDGSYHP